MADLTSWLLALLPGGLWCAWWLWAVSWKRVWPVLARGGWVGVLLLIFLASLAWSSLFPRPLWITPVVALSNFWWQLGAAGGLTLAALFCGWVQEQLGWAPGSVTFDPPVTHSHGHGHDHAAQDVHAHDHAGQFGQL